MLIPVVKVNVSVHAMKVYKGEVNYIFVYTNIGARWK
jgi:hypothetical protein